MNYTLGIRYLNPDKKINIPNGKIAEGITIKQDRMVKEILNPPIDFLVSIIQNYGIAVAAALTAEYLFRYLDRREKQVEINNQVININLVEIKQVIINIYQSEKDES